MPMNWRISARRKRACICASRSCRARSGRICGGSDARGLNTPSLGAGGSTRCNAAGCGEPPSAHGAAISLRFACRASLRVTRSTIGPLTMTDTANLGLPFIEGSQAQKHVTHNEALRILDAAIQIAVLDLTRTSPPSSPADGERHVVASGATGAWAGRPTPSRPGRTARGRFLRRTPAGASGRSPTT